MIEAFQLLEEASKDVAVIVNEGKTKYMVAANTQNCSKRGAVEIGGYNFEGVDNVICLGSLMTGDNNGSEEIRNRLIDASRSYFGLKSNSKSQLRQKFLYTKR